MRRFAVVLGTVIVPLVCSALRVDSLPGRADPSLRVTCNTCHRGRTNPLDSVAVAKPPAPLGDSSPVRRSSKARSE